LLYNEGSVHYVGYLKQSNFAFSDSFWFLYRVSRGECARLRENVP